MANGDPAAMSAASFHEYVNWFRNSTPYINAHKDSTFVLVFGGDIIAAERFSAIVSDIALLATLGARIVLVHGLPAAFTAALRAPLDSAPVRGRRITDAAALAAAVATSGSLRARIEALFSVGLVNSPLHGLRSRVCSGNFVTAQPLGIWEGIDFEHSGKVRRIDCEGIAAQLERNNIVLLPALGYSPTGEIFNLEKEDVAVAVASGLNVDKLILFEDALLTDADGQQVRDLPLTQAQQLLEIRPSATLEAAVQVCQLGVERCHVLDWHVDGALLQELFTRDGIGTMINRDRYESIRVAAIEDVGGIMELIAPLERDGTLVRRSREHLELDIGNFSVVERDGAIIGCAALYPDKGSGCAELACVAMHPSYRRSGRANRLLAHIEARARAEGATRLFALTTRTAHWFVERGFRTAELGELPARRREMYNYQRNSRVFIKPL